MSKGRKVLVSLGLIALAVGCFVTLRPRDEPKYQGRYLSEWMALYVRRDQQPISTELVEAEKAVKAIGTNALPSFLKWIRSAPSPWRFSLHSKLPSWVAGNRTVERLIYGGAMRRAYHGYLGFGILGTNGFVAMSELEAMMRDRSKPSCSSYAMGALIKCGEPALPIFQATLADPHQPGRAGILYEMRELTREISTTDKYLPIFVVALTNDDASVRITATNVVINIAPELLTNAPGQ